MQAAIKVARQFKLAEQTGDRAAYDKAIALSEQMPAEKDTRVECPHCHRKFAESKYFLKLQELHIQVSIDHFYFACSCGWKTHPKVQRYCQQTKASSNKTTGKIVLSHEGCQNSE